MWPIANALSKHGSASTRCVIYSISWHEARLILAQFKWPSTAEYTLLMDQDIKTIYTKHPLTGEITTHTRPFPHLPQFSVDTAHPALLTLQATKFRLFHHYSPNPHDTLMALILMRSEHRVHPGFFKDWSSYWKKDGPCTGAGAAKDPSHGAGKKRKAIEDSSLGNKRARISSSDGDKVDAQKSLPSPPQTPPSSLCKILPEHPPDVSARPAARQTNCG